METLMLGLLLAVSAGLVAYGLIPAGKRRDVQVLRRVAHRAKAKTSRRPGWRRRRPQRRRW